MLKNCINRAKKLRYRGLIGIFIKKRPFLLMDSIIKITKSKTLKSVEPASRLFYL